MHIHIPFCNREAFVNGRLNFIGGCKGRAVLSITTCTYYIEYKYY